MRIKKPFAPQRVKGDLYGAKATTGIHAQNLLYNREDGGI